MGTRQKLLSGFFPLRGGGGYPPFPLSFFAHNDFPLRGGMYPPIPLRKKSTKKELFLAKITPILTLFDPVLLGKFSTIFCYGPIAK